MASSAKFDGKIEIDREHPEKSSVVSQNRRVSSIDTGIVKRDNHLRSAEFFNVAKFPEMTFKSGRVETDRSAKRRHLWRSHDARRHETDHTACEANEPDLE